MWIFIGAEMAFLPLWHIPRPRDPRCSVRFRSPCRRRRTRRDLFLRQTKLRHTLRIHVRPEDLIPAHKKVPKVIHDLGVVYVMIVRGTDTHHTSHAVDPPRQRVLGVNEHQIRRVHGSKDNVAPAVTMNEIGSRKQGYENHQRRIDHMTRERVKQSGIRPSMMLLVTAAIEPRESMLGNVCQVHEKIDAKKLEPNERRIEKVKYRNARMSRVQLVVGRWHQIEHPRQTKIGKQQRETLPSRRVRDELLRKVQHGFLNLDHISLGVKETVRVTGVVKRDEHELEREHRAHADR